MIVYILISLIIHYLNTIIDTSQNNLDTFWILFRALSDTWPPLHVATKDADKTSVMASKVSLLHALG